MTEQVAEASAGPLCPNCRADLRDSLRQVQILPPVAERAASHAMELTFCGECGSTLHIAPAPRGPLGPGRPIGDVAAPAEPETLAGQFQLRCRDLIQEIRALGFGPGGWIGLINELGAVDAAKRLLADHRVLPVTPWLLGRGHPELTMEQEIQADKWAALFSDEERSEARRRLVTASGPTT